MSKIATAAEAPQFDAAYWAAQPTEVQALHALPMGRNARQPLAEQLAAEGFIIDFCIMVLAYGPWWTMNERTNDGYTWTPAANQPPIMVAPGISLAGYQTYNPKIIPAGSCITTLDFDALPVIFPRPVKL